MADLASFQAVQLTGHKNVAEPTIWKAKHRNMDDRGTAQCISNLAVATYIEIQQYNQQSQTYSSFTYTWTLKTPSETTQTTGP